MFIVVDARPVPIFIVSTFIDVPIFKIDALSVPIFSVAFTSYVSSILLYICPRTVKLSKFPTVLRLL